MKKNKPVEDWKIHRPLQTALNKLSDIYFDFRKHKNREFAKLSKHSREFFEDTQKIRGDFDIHDLIPSEDFAIIPKIDSEGHVYDKQGSKWFYHLSNERQKQFETAIYKLLDKYRLPQNFYDWLEVEIIYNRIPHNTPVHNWSLELDFFADPKTLQNVPLSTPEKRLLKAKVKTRLGIGKGRPPKAKAKIYQDFLKALDKSKNKERRKPALAHSLDIAKSGKTYKEQAAELFNIKNFDKSFVDKNKAAEKLNYQNLRKRKQRISKRIKDLGK